jgi:hypothetical protein
MTELEILADTRLLLRGTSEPVPDPLPALRRQRRIARALVALDTGERVTCGGLVLRKDGRKYLAGPLDPMSRAEIVELMSDVWRR